jgi:hypothetical protein
MRRLACCALVAGLSVVGVAWGASSPDVRAGRGPFIPTDTLDGGSGSGFWGDRSSARAGEELGCFSRRHYSFTITLRNRSRRPATLTDARGPDPLPSVVARVAVQFRHAPPPPTGDMIVVPLRHWSAAPPRPLTIRPGKSAIVQTNFLMRHCSNLKGGRTVRIPGTFSLSYRQSGRAGRQRVVQRSAGFSVIAGPIIRSCSRVPGSVSLTTANVGCAAARAAAPACHRMRHGTWGSCTVARRRWDCDLHSSWVQQCFFPDRTSRWYRVRWVKRPG